jgi:uncharacterized protein
MGHLTWRGRSKLAGFSAVRRHIWLWVAAAVAAVVVAVLAALLIHRPLPANPSAMPAPASFLDDQAQLLSPAFAAAKNQYIEHLSRTMRIAQIRVVILPRVPSGALEDFTIQAATRWKVGVGGVDNGLLLFIFRDERALRLEVGYGLESVIPDALADQMLSEQLVPAFSRGQFDTGIEDFLDVLDKTLEASEAASQRASSYASMLPFVINVLRTAPRIAVQVWRVFLDADIQARMVLSLFGVMLAFVLASALVGIASGVPALLMLPWRVYQSKSLRTFGTPAVREQFVLKNFVKRPPEVFAQVAAELELGKIITALYFAGGTVIGIAFLFIGSSALIGGLGQYSGAGATVHWSTTYP